MSEQLEHNSSEVSTSQLNEIIGRKTPDLYTNEGQDQDQILTIQIASKNLDRKIKLTDIEITKTKNYIIESNKEILNKYLVSDIKKLKDIPSATSKKNLIKNYIILKSVKIIQRFMRKRYLKDNVCPISLTEVNYPYYVYKSGKKLIYYNLNILAQYLVETGNFRDPNTRKEYSKEDLINIDKLLSQNKITLDTIGSNGKPFKNIMAAFKDNRFYIIKKEKEHKIMNTVAWLDHLTSNLRDSVEYNKQTLGLLDETYDDYKKYYMCLYKIDKEYADTYFQRTITSIIKITGPKVVHNYQNGVVDNLFMMYDSVRIKIDKKTNNS